ncbi:hypothetical protein CRG98_035872 [Punica granatum]|uniref:F-box domain-containing protein n=1 Tax=Punica granatum TaxID=22663 RepID=A0A2I0IK94_PUNGR|nr:hypothetical protein CRG98_035872 [Punica granatum]
MAVARLDALVGHTSSVSLHTLFVYSASSLRSAIYVMGNKRARMTSQTEDKADRLSELPEHLIDHILSLLPIKDAVKTSMLSRKWRYRWTTLPELVFDDLCAPTSSDAQSSNSVLGKIINDVLLIHTGPVRKFVISHKKFHADAEIGRWLYYLSRVSLKVLVLNFSVGHCCKTLSSLFSCQHLVNLKLSRCSVNLPSTFGGFKHLKRMELSLCSLSQDGLERLIMSCPLLEKMILKSVDWHISRLHITAPKLRCLILIGTFNLKDVRFGANRLTEVGVCFPKDINESGRGYVNQSYSNLVDFFDQLPLIAVLQVRNLLKCWSCGDMPEKLPSPCLYLRTLRVYVDFGSEKEISIVLCLLRSCPELRGLQLKACPSSGQRNADAGYGFWERHRSPHPLLQLRAVAIFGISGSRLELGLIRFVLGNSPLLKKMFIVGPVPSTSQLLKDLLQIERASPHAQVVDLDAKDIIPDKFFRTFLSLHED